MDVLKILEKEYFNMGCALKFSTPFELLVATMLSAQTTDVNVNKATSVLFKVYNTPEQFAALSQEELIKYIKVCGFYRVKSNNIINMSKMLIEKYNGKVPDTVSELVKLPGVGRKTADVVVSNAYGKDAIAVDTHVFRVSNRLGLADSNDVFNTEKQLMECIPKKYWSKAHYWLIWHGRKVCTARKPKCEICPVKEFCRYYSKDISK